MIKAEGLGYLDAVGGVDGAGRKGITLLQGRM
jgi:hypothetical protein